MEYVIVTGYTTSNLAAQVNSYIQQGFVLQGGLALRADTGQYFQAMVKLCPYKK